MYFPLQTVATVYKNIAYALITLGVLFFFSALSVDVFNSDFSFFKAVFSQLILGLGIGLLLMNLLEKKLKVKQLQTLTPILFFLSIGFISLLLSPLGVEANGATRWLNLGFLTIQPSEILKVTSVLFLSYLFSKKFTDSIKKPLVIYFSFLILLFVCAYIQPDYGFFIITVIALFSIAFVRGMKVKWWAITLTVCLIAAGYVYSNVQYVGDRIDTTYKIITGSLTQADYYQTAYQTTKGIEIIKESGFFGSGYALGREKYGNIPEITTDSIFILILEESGFFGGFLIISLFTVLILLGYIISMRVKNPFATLVGVGINTLLAAQIFINIFSVFGLTLTGVPLPLFSKGGTSLLITLICIGIMLHISRCKD